MSLNLPALAAEYTAGHNSGSRSIASAGLVLADLGAWLRETPVIEREEDAKAGAEHVRRCRSALADMEDERKSRVGPLNDQVKDINGEYRAASSPLERVLETLRDRMTAWAHREEDKRRAEAEAKALEARIAERVALAADAAEREAKEAAGVGEVGVDVAGASITADDAFARANRARRDAARAERDSHVKVGGGIGRAVSLRSKEVLTVTDFMAAVSALGMTERIEAVLVTEARAYRTRHGALPPGITSTTERSI